MTIVFIISAVYAGALGGFMAGWMLASDGCEDAFRAGYRAGALVEREAGDGEKWPEGKAARS